MKATDTPTNRKATDMQYRGYTISKTDTGGRTLGREIAFDATALNGKVQFSTSKLKDTKAQIDAYIDAPPNAAAVRAAVIASIEGN